jgi:hypothetical protein
MRAYVTAARIAHGMTADMPEHAREVGRKTAPCTTRSPCSWRAEIANSEGG